MNHLSAINYINTHSLTGLKAGHDRDTFLEIWMVVTENRIFARSWGLAEKSWYTTFLQNPYGQIKCGDSVFEIMAKPVSGDALLDEKINQAYLEKYNHGDNSFYAQGIIQPKHVANTMEFVVLEK